MTAADLQSAVPAAAQLDAADAWAEYAKVCKLHRNSPTYEAAENAAWNKLLATLSEIGWAA